MPVSNLTACPNRHQGWFGHVEDNLFHSESLPLKVMQDYSQEII